MESALFIIVLVSVLGPVLGSLIGVIRKPSKKFMYNMLSFAAGVMIAVSFLELIPRSIEVSSVLITVLGIILGSGIMFLIDRLIPHIHPELCSPEPGYRIKRTALYLLIGIFMHNFPEGMAVALGGVAGDKVSVVIAIAIAVQNIPEGICTSAPYFYYTKKRWKSFLVSSSTAIPILIGFFITYELYQYLSSTVVGLIIGATAGLMIYITSDELIPSSCCRTTSHVTIFSLILGILFVVLLGLI